MLPAQRVHTHRWNLKGVSWLKAIIKYKHAHEILENIRIYLQNIKHIGKYQNK